MGYRQKTEGKVDKRTINFTARSFQLIVLAQMMQSNLRGELTLASMDKSGISTLKDLEFVRQFAKFLRISSSTVNICSLSKFVAIDENHILRK